MLSRRTLGWVFWPLLLACQAALAFPQSANDEPEIHFKAPEPTGLGENATFICTIYDAEVDLVWETADGEVLKNEKKHIIKGDRNLDEPKVSTVLTVTQVGLADQGEYFCRSTAKNFSRSGNLTVFVDLLVETASKVKVKVNERAKLHCNVSGYPINFIRWRIDGLDEVLNGSKVSKTNETFWNSVIHLTENAGSADNGTYICEAGTLNEKIVSARAALLVLNKPHLEFGTIKAIDTRRVFVNWTINNGNLPITSYLLKHTVAGEEKGWQYASKKVEVNYTSFILEGLEPNKAYKLQLVANNEMGNATVSPKSPVKTRQEDPIFVPDLSISGSGGNSITMKWNSPPQPIHDFVHYYMLELQHNGMVKKALQPANHSNGHIFYMFGELQPATTYSLRVAACSEFTNECNAWSKMVEGKTMDQPSGPVSDLKVQCKHDNVSRSSLVFVSWSEPKDPRGSIARYSIDIRGSASFTNERGVLATDDYGPKSKSVERKDAIFENLPSNTNYTVRVYGVNAYRMKGEDTEVHCNMPPTVPDREKLTNFNWGVVGDDKLGYLLQLFTSRISERNGPICCYRIVIVKLGHQQKTMDLPPPENTVLSSFDEVRLSERGGAYVAEALDSANLKPSTFIGDGSQKNSDGEDMCRICFNEPPPTAETFTVPSETVSVPTEATNTTSPLISALVGKKEKQITISDLFPAHIQDGPLDLDSQYTGFVQIIVHGQDNMKLQVFSSYFTSIRPNSHVIVSDSQSDVLSLALNITLALLILVLILLVSICLVTRYSKSIAGQQGVNMSLRDSFRAILCNKGYSEVEMVCGRNFCSTLRGGANGRIPVMNSPPDMTPILRDEMATAYQERHKDSDYGFQHEFEQLPDRFPDRTTKNSESRENIYKNRYPDIKSYDQTRVKLSQVDGIVGSDYINANFVVGYKERKKFICAQGPMENTVSDFWKMVWEQHLELVLMLTNLEEYSKTKCAKYWPDEGDKEYGDITVTHIQEKRYSDFIVRELKISRSTPEKEERSIIQHHYLVWKDFMAPEHPSGILKFIKQMNEVYSLEKGPILIHCSAGVGRTGTLVALDSLLQQVQEEGEVSIFNTVCDLRHQRNFLVQNLKQYIFIYRALVEFSQFGDTERKVAKFKTDFEQMKQTEAGKTKPSLEEEFEKLLRIPDEGKPCTVANGEENKPKNQSESIMPYDRNRVILTPMPGKEHSTYINASFIEGYDNSESFIITQDPLESTIADFWRMISEQGITTLVMLSDLKEGSKKCPRYWPDDETNHNHIRVKYSQSESGPYFTKREFNVTNCKTDESINVTQFQYNGWPTADGEMPSVARGLTDLVDHVQTHQESLGTSGPIAVHCHMGVDRSAIFVALAVLIQQIRTEKKADVFSVVRKLRCQRQGMLDSYAQYEFLHRAVVTYIDLHHLASEDT